MSLHTFALVYLSSNLGGMYMYTSSTRSPFRRLLKDEESLDFQHHTAVIANKLMLEGPDRRSWSLEPNGIFSVKSLAKHLSLPYPINHELEKSLWHTKSPRRVNITVWLTIFGSLNFAAVVQKKLPSHSLSPMFALYA